MNIRRLKNRCVNRVKWDECALRYSTDEFYSLSWFLDRIYPEWEGIVVGDYEAVMPVFIGEKIFLEYLFQPPFIQKCVYSGPDELFLEVVRVLSEKYRLLDFYCSHHCNLPGLYIKERTNLVLDISEDYQSVHKSYSKNCLRNLKKTFHVEVTEGRNISELTSLFLLNKAQKIKGKIKLQNYTQYNNFINNCIDSKKGFIVEGKISGEIVASAFFLIDRNRIVFHFSGINNIGRDNYAMFSIVDYVIRNYAGKRFRLDFEGSMDEGTARFYSSFGAENIPYFHLFQNKLPIPLKWFKLK